MKIRMARFKDKPDADLDGRPELSTGGKWRYAAWVEDTLGEHPPAELADADGLAYYPELHLIEGPHTVELPPSIAKVVEVLDALAEQLGGLEYSSDASQVFVDHLKRTLLQVWALALGDSDQPVYYAKSFEEYGGYRWAPLFSEVVVG